jgi:hypothetical protein
MLRGFSSGLRSASRRIREFLPAEGWPKIGVIGRLFRTSAVPGCAIVLGDGEFNFPVMGMSQYQTELGALCNDPPSGAIRKRAALLVPEADKQNGGNIVFVQIDGKKVGHLSWEASFAFISALRAGGFGRAACGAIIVASRRPEKAETDCNFDVRLNATLPFRLLTP